MIDFLFIYTSYLNKHVLFNDTMKYISKDDTIIINPEFNEPLNDEHIAILSKYQKVIFSDYLLTDELFESYENNNNNKWSANKFKQQVNNLPKSITHITFGQCFNQSVDNLPDSITHLTFGYYFNKPVDNLPNSITHITFGQCFNQSVDNLPDSITHLIFETWFNYPVDNLPNSITHLTFGYSFNHPVDNLPNSITHLTFGNCFNHPVDNLPKNVQQIKLMYNKNYTAADFAQYKDAEILFVK